MISTPYFNQLQTELLKTNRNVYLRTALKGFGFSNREIEGYYKGIVCSVTKKIRKG